MATAPIAPASSIGQSVGVHTWTVQAYNAGGGSGWTEPWTIQVTRHHVYLPLVLGSP